MLYDPKWEKQTETKADPLTLPAFIAWLEKQPGSATYCYQSNGDCLIAQYFQHHRISETIGGWTYRPIGGGPRAKIPEFLKDIAYDGPRTFGDALERARSIAAR